MPINGQCANCRQEMVKCVLFGSLSRQEKKLEVRRHWSGLNVQYLKLCRLGSGDLSRRFGCGLARLRLEAERTDRGGETTRKKCLKVVLHWVFFSQNLHNHLQTNTNSSDGDGRTRHRANCGTDVCFQRRQVTQAPHSSLKGVTAV